MGMSGKACSVLVGWWVGGVGDGWQEVVVFKRVQQVGAPGRPAVCGWGGGWVGGDVTLTQALNQIPLPLSEGRDQPLP